MKKKMSIMHLKKYSQEERSIPKWEAALVLVYRAVCASRESTSTMCRVLTRVRKMIIKVTIIIKTTRNSNYGYFIKRSVIDIFFITLLCTQQFGY